MKTNLKTKMKGFTLIELLVVITIIGILASIVIVNLNSARGRGQDAAIKEQMSQIRSTVALYYSDNYGYSSGTTGALTGTCVTSAGAANSVFANTAFADADFITSAVGVYKNSSVLPVCDIAPNSVSKSQSWVMYGKLRVNSTDWWCVDSSGQSVQVTGTSTVPPSFVTSATGDYTCQ